MRSWVALIENLGLGKSKGSLRCCLGRAGCEDDEVEGKEEEAEGKAELKGRHHQGMICRKRIIAALRILFMV